MVNKKRLATGFAVSAVAWLGFVLGNPVASADSGAHVHDGQ